jgi:hypothetical protein
VFRSASPAQQDELLSLARRQGLLYFHQFPPQANGTRPAAHADEPGARQVLQRLLNGHVQDLEPARPAPVPVFDAALDDFQREAVARALGTPDVCLIQGLPGTGKSRVVAEVILQAAARGWRTLLLAPGSGALDRVLLQIGTHDSLCPLRCPGPEERPESLAPAIRALTFAERVRALGEQALAGAQQALGQQEEHCRRLRRAEALWPRLEELARQYDGLGEQRDAIARRNETLLDEVERAAAGKSDTVSQRGCDTARTNPTAAADDQAVQTFLVAVAKCIRAYQDDRARLDEGLTEAERKLDEQRRELADRAPKVQALMPLVRAKERSQIWKGAWWRALFKGNVRGKLQDLEQKQTAAHEEIHGLEETLQLLGRKRTEAEETYRAKRGGLVEAETRRRKAELDERDSALRAEQERLNTEWRRAGADLSPHGPLPSEATSEAVAASREAGRLQLEHTEQAVAFAREWLACLQESTPSLAGRLPGYVNLVAATPAGLAADPHFGDQASAAPFDLLILEEADQVTEGDFLKAARRTRRWVLVGEPVWENPGGAGTEALRISAHDPRPALAVARPHAAVLARAHAGGLAHSSSLRPGFFQRLWEQLHCDPRKLPFSWAREESRLCCRLRPVGADQRRWLETERVADFPEIELRILALPRTPPALAEVVFPPSMSIHEAKEYIYRQLEELPVQAPGHSVRWVEGPDYLMFHLAATESANGTCVPLEAGVRELVGESAAAGWHTCRLEFDRRAGWERPQAEDWVRRHLGVRDLGRTLRLDVPRRMRPPLAAFLSDLLFEEAGGYDTHSGESTPGPCGVEFVPVPPVDSSRPANGRRHAGPPRRAPAAKGGAGLELDLAAGRHADRLPSELRAVLPNRGFVNYLEAQAVVRRLEALVDDPAVAGCGPAGGCTGGPAVAVLALYPSQAELIRRLIAQSPKLRTAGTNVEVDVPGGFRHREAHLVLLSLTRSHGHRAVSFGEGPQALALALTRARARLVVFGDTGTLARRSQWEGPLDHLDGNAAGRERKLVAHLLRYLQGQGRHAGVFHVREGNNA